MISQAFQEEVWNKLNSIERRLIVAGGGGAGAAPADAEYIVMSLNAILSDERVLTAGIGLNLTDGGAGGLATLDSELDGTGFFEEDGVGDWQPIVANKAWDFCFSLDGNNDIQPNNIAFDHDENGDIQLIAPV